MTEPFLSPRAAVGIMLVMVFIAVVSFGVGVLRTTADAAPSCQEYLDQAEKVARQTWIGSEGNQAQALKTISWVMIYQACRSR